MLRAGIWMLLVEHIHNRLRFLSIFVGVLKSWLSMRIFFSRICSALPYVLPDQIRLVLRSSSFQNESVFVLMCFSFISELFLSISSLELIAYEYLEMKYFSAKFFVLSNKSRTDKSKRGSSWSVSCFPFASKCISSFILHSHLYNRL